MATYDGANIFGSCTVRTQPNPVAVQTNAYPGIDGLEEIRLGARGRTSIVEGWLVGATVADLNSAEIAVRAKVVEAGAKTFVDNYGNSWPNVRVVSYEPQGRVMACAGAPLGGAGYCRAYTVVLLHLS